MGEPAEEWQLGVVGVFVIVGLADAVHESIGIVAGELAKVKSSPLVGSMVTTLPLCLLVGYRRFLLVGVNCQLQVLAGNCFGVSKGWLLLPLRIAIVPPSVPRK